MSYKNKRKSQILMIQKQIQILYHIKNQYIVQLRDHFQDIINSDIYLIMQYIDGGDLYKSVFAKRVQLQKQQIATIGYQICIALSQLHRNNIIHRDLKLQNVIYLPNKSIKLVDLGCSNYYGQDFQRITKIGTKMYYSPQIVLGQGQDDRLDIWCLGVLLYELLFMNSPFRGDIQTKIKKLQYQIPSPYNTDKDLVDMFKRIFCYKQKRIKAQQLLNHPWMQTNIRKQTYLNKLQIHKLFSEQQEIKYKQFLLKQISKCQNDIEKLKDFNQKIKIKITLEQDDDDQDVF